MVEVLLPILQQLGRFEEQHAALLAQQVQHRDVVKGEVLLPEGAVCKSVFYAVKGAFYQFNVKEETEEHIIDLHVQNEWFFNHSSFVLQKPSQTCIKAYTDGEILELTVASLHDLIAQSPAFLQMGRLLEQSTARVQFFDHNMTPTEKYQFILDHRPDLIQAFPLKVVAAYLKITPETLSRVRESFSRGRRSS